MAEASEMFARLRCLQRLVILQRNVRLTLPILPLHMPVTATACYCYGLACACYCLRRLLPEPATACYCLHLLLPITACTC